MENGGKEREKRVVREKVVSLPAFHVRVADAILEDSGIEGC